MIRIKRDNLINVILHAVFLLVVYVLQAEVFSRVPILGCSPVLLSSAAVGVALLEGSGRGSVFGLFAGILCDAAFARPIAVFTITLTVLAFIAGLLGESLFRKSFQSYVLVSFCALVVTTFIQMFSLMFLADASPMPLIFTAVLQLLVSLLLALPMYIFMKLLGRRVRFS